MPKAEAGSAKAIGNAMKAKGLGRLRWYCQVCAKQCRDENGFKMHSQSESHLRQMLVVGENAGKHIDDFSKGFMDDFIGMLSRRYNTQRVRANQVYNEYIQDKSHLHMNATKWVTLTEFVKYLGREGVVRADENDKGWWISWVDTSPKALARQAEAMKKERADMDDEQRERKRLREQIERAKEQAEELQRLDGGGSDESEGLKREDGGKISLSLSLGGFGKPKVEDLSEEIKAEDTIESNTNAEAGPGPSSMATSSEERVATSTPAASTKLSFSAAGLKRPAPNMNVFKQSSSKKDKSTVIPTTSFVHSNSLADTIMDDDTRMKALKGKKFLTAAERLMLEDMERKRRGGGGSGGVGGFRGVGYQGMGPSRGGR